MRKAPRTEQDFHRIARERAEQQRKHTELIQNECVHAANELAKAWNEFKESPGPDTAEAVQIAHDHYTWATAKHAQHRPSAA